MARATVGDWPEFVGTTSEAWEAALPGKIELGAHTFAFRVLPESEAEARGVFGYFHPISGIEIASGLPLPLLVDTVLHEILHAIFWTAGIRDKEDISDERAVAVLASGLALFIRQNPWFAGFVQSAGIIGTSPCRSRHR